MGVPVSTRMKGISALLKNEIYEKGRQRQLQTQKVKIYETNVKRQVNIAQRFKMP